MLMGNQDSNWRTSDPKNRPPIGQGTFSPKTSGWGFISAASCISSGPLGLSAEITSLDSTPKVTCEMHHFKDFYHAGTLIANYIFILNYLFKLYPVCLREGGNFHNVARVRQVPWFQCHGKCLPSWVWPPYHLRQRTHQCHGYISMVCMEKESEGWNIQEICSWLTLDIYIYIYM